MNSREGVSSSRRYQVRLPAGLASSLEGFARQSCLGLAPTIRLLVARGLISQTLDPAATLAAHVAAEHALLLVASILPEGERRLRSLSEQAAQAAEERLVLVREQMQGLGGLE
jgi:hypothetical protein